MRKKLRWIRHLVTLAILLGGTGLHGQGTAFTYQGRLQDGANHATGSYDLAFAIWNNAMGGAQVGAGVTNPATGVSNGLFSVILDFGPGVFDGTPRWLEIHVRTNGNETFSPLSPRQALTAAPYAIFAGGVNAAGISGPIPSANIASGTITSNMLASGAAAANLAASGQAAVPVEAMVLSSNPFSTNLTAAGYSRFGGQLDLSWQQSPASGAPTARNGHVAVWTGSKMLVWGGVDNAGQNPKNTGGIYDPAANSWQPITTNGAPSARSRHTAVWTGTEMIVWGGFDGAWLNDGGRYDPATDTWMGVATNYAPSVRRDHKAVWTGNEMIVWGGENGEVILNTGARYLPVTDTWIPMSTNSAPEPRVLHTAIWTGSEMVVWGGLVSVLKQYNDGGRYNPSSDTWIAVTTNGAPTPRAYHVAAWTGSAMLVWGGQGANIFGDGSRYTPSTDSWVPVSAIAAPTARYSPSSVWTGTEMVVWGGASVSGFLNTGARYSPTNDSWSVVSMTGAPNARGGHTAIWSGTEMILFGGYNNVTGFGDCNSYAPSRVMYLYQKP